MNLKEYLCIKYKTDTPTTMTSIEAGAFGIKYPLPAGWLKTYGHRILTDKAAERIKAGLQKREKKRLKNGKEKHELNLAAINVINSRKNKQKNDFTAPQINKKNNEINFVKSKEFLLSYEWRQLRMQALLLHGARCQCCGASPETGAVMNVDHIKPRSRFPELALNIDNLQILCDACNHGKSNWDTTDWRPRTDSYFDPEIEFQERFKSGL